MCVCVCVCVCVSSSRPMTGSSLPSRAACQSGVFVSVFVGGRKGACVCVRVLITTYDRVQLAVTSSLSIRCFCVSVFVGGRKGACVHVCVCVSSSRPMTGSSLPSPAACQSGVFVSVFVGGRKGACVRVCVRVLITAYDKVQLAITSSLSIGCFCECVCGREKRSMRVCVRVLITAYDGTAGHHEQPVNELFLWEE